VIDGLVDRTDKHQVISRLLKQIRATEVSLFETHCTIAKKDETLYQNLTSLPVHFVKTISAVDPAQMSFSLLGSLSRNRRCLFKLKNGINFNEFVSERQLLLRTEVVGGPEGNFYRQQRTLLMLHHYVAIYSSVVSSYILGIKPSEAREFASLMFPELDELNFISCIFSLPFTRSEELHNFMSDAAADAGGYAFDRISR
jgi:hypothetical protein